MTLRNDVKSFIEENIEIVSQEDFDQLYDLADTWLTDLAIRHLTAALSIALEQDVEQFAKENLMKRFKTELDDWINTPPKPKVMLNNIQLSHFINLYMSTLNGIDFDEFQVMVFDYLETYPYKNLEYSVDGEGNIYLQRI